MGRQSNSLGVYPPFPTVVSRVSLAHLSLIAGFLGAWCFGSIKWAVYDVMNFSWVSRDIRLQFLLFRFGRSTLIYLLSYTPEAALNLKNVYTCLYFLTL